MDVIVDDDETHGLKDIDEDMTGWDPVGGYWTDQDLRISQAKNCEKHMVQFLCCRPCQPQKEDLHQCGVASRNSPYLPHKDFRSSILSIPLP